MPLSPKQLMAALLIIVSCVACSDVHDPMQVSPGVTSPRKVLAPKSHPADRRAVEDAQAWGIATNVQLVRDVTLVHDTQTLIAAAAALARRSVPRSASSGTVTGPGQVNGYPCGGDLPACCTLRIESGGTPAAQNPVSSSSGLWQFTHDTWAGYGGYSEAKYAPPDVQNERARQVFAGGAGWGNWKGDGCYPGG